MEKRVKRFVVKGEMRCKIENDKIICEPISENTFYEEAKYWLIEAGAPVDEYNIQEVCEAMDEAGRKKAKELAEE